MKHPTYSKRVKLEQPLAHQPIDTAMRRLRTYASNRSAPPRPGKDERMTFVMDTAVFLSADVDRLQCLLRGDRCAADRKVIIWWDGRPAVRH